MSIDRVFSQKLMIIGVLITSSYMVACSGSDRDFTIADAEKAGFHKRHQQMFQMIGAIDGWSGTWLGENVELYQFESPENLNLFHFESWIANGNTSNWAGLCQRGNLMLVSKGRQACVKLSGL